MEFEHSSCLVIALEPRVRDIVDWALGQSRDSYCHLAVSPPGKFSHVKKALTWGLLKAFTSERKSSASVVLCHLQQSPSCFVHGCSLGAVGRAPGKVSLSSVALTRACQSELSHCLESQAWPWNPALPFLPPPRACNKKGPGASLHSPRACSEDQGSLVALLERAGSVSRWSFSLGNKLTLNKQTKRCQALEDCWEWGIFYEKL